LSPKRGLLVGGSTVIAFTLAWLLFVALPKWYKPTPARAATTPEKALPTPGRKIKARLFYVGDDGSRLVGVERDVAFGEGTVEQARQIIEAQIAAPADQLVSAVPPNTKLRAIFVTERGEAFVDLSGEVVAGHTGGSTNEVLTVYALVNVLTANLPAVKSVQVLVDGRQVDTLAGHIDLRRPIEKNLEWVQ
jgi:spore germination protein GerM